jgi:hypothetical protein
MQAKEEEVKSKSRSKSMHHHRFASYFISTRSQEAKSKEAIKPHIHTQATL